MVVQCNRCGNLVRSHRTTGSDTAVAFDLGTHDDGRWELRGLIAHRSLEPPRAGLRLHKCWKEKHATR